MKKQLTQPGIAAAAVVAAVAALAGASAIRAHTNAPIRTTASYGALYEHVLPPVQPPGFASLSCPIIQRDAIVWAGGNVDVAAALRRNGFVAGLRDMRYGAVRGAVAVSSVAQFRSAVGAQRELADEGATARRESRSFAAFAVSVPGARAFSLRGRDGTSYSVLFVDGRYLHRVSVRVPLGSAREAAVTAAAALYARVHHSPGAAAATSSPHFPGP
jgi:hypothetical protein